MTINYLLLILYVLSSCGGGDLPSAPNSASPSPANGTEPSKVDPELTVDLAKLSPQELQEMTDTLSKRNEAEKKELETLKALNPKLCTRLKTLRNTCKIAVTIMTDEATSKLDCGDGTSTPPNKISISIEADGKYEMIADNLLKSQIFERGTSDLKFSPIAGGNMTSNPKLIDVRKLVLRRTDGGAPNPGFALSLKVNGGEVLNGSDVTRASGDSLQMQLVKFMRFADSCHVSGAEIQAIRTSAAASPAIAEKKPEAAPVKPSAEPVASEVKK